MGNGTILIVDDQPGVRQLLSVLCQQEGMSVMLAKNGLEAINKIKKECPDGVLMDVRMPVMDGIKALEWIKKEHPALPVIMMTAFTSEENLKDAGRMGVEDIWFKPFDINDLRDRLRLFNNKCKADEKKKGIS